MNWNEKKNHLTEQLEILKKLKDRFGDEVIEIAGRAKLAIHKKWMKELAQGKSRHLSEIFKHSALSVTSDNEEALKYEVLVDSETRFAVKITKCKYADFYIENNCPEIGYAMHCALDFGETEAFSHDVLLKRTKTIMRGGDYCDHCYELK